MNGRLRKILIGVAAVTLLMLWTDFNPFHTPDVGAVHAEQAAPAIQWLLLSEGLQQVSDTHQKILMFIYTDWCHYCKKMQSTTFQDPRVIQFIQETFIPVKLNAESDTRVSVWDGEITERDISRVLGATAYPTTVFLAEDIIPVASQPGYVEPELYLTLMDYVSQDLMGVQDFRDFAAHWTPPTP